MHGRSLLLLLVALLTLVAGAAAVTADDPDPTKRVVAEDGVAHCVVDLESRVALPVKGLSSGQDLLGAANQDCSCPSSEVVELLAQGADPVRHLLAGVPVREHHARQKHGQVRLVRDHFEVVKDGEVLGRHRSAPEPTRRHAEEELLTSG